MTACLPQITESDNTYVSVDVNVCKCCDLRNSTSNWWKLVLSPNFLQINRRTKYFEWKNEFLFEFIFENKEEEKKNEILLPMPMWIICCEFFWNLTLNAHCQSLIDCHLSLFREEKLKSIDSNPRSETMSALIKSVNLFNRINKNPASIYTVVRNAGGKC